MGKFLGFAHILAGLLTLLFLWEVVRCRMKERLWIACGVVLAVSAAAGVLLAGMGERIPVELITPLQEAASRNNIFQLYGFGTHSGFNFAWLTHLGQVPEIYRLQNIVFFNAVLTLANCVIFFFAASCFLRFLPVVLILTCANFANVITGLTAFSELPSALLTTYFWMGVLSVSVLCEHMTPAPVKRRGRAMRIMGAALLLVIVTGLLLLTRFEYAIFSFFALGILFLEMVFADVHLKKGESRLLGFLGRPARWLCRRPWPQICMVLILVCGLWPWVIGLVSRTHHAARWFVPGIDPLNFSFLNMPVFLSVCLPLGVVVLFILGLIHSVKKWARFLLLPLGLVILYRTYYTASHGVFFEMIRYMTALSPIVFFLAIFGWKEIEAFAGKRGWEGNWRKPGVLVLCVLMLVPPINGVSSLFGWEARSHSFLLDRDLQREVRYLGELSRNYSDCVFVSPIRKFGTDEYEYIVFGKDIAWPVIVARQDSPALETAAQAAPGNRCVLFYHGLDCNLDQGKGCGVDADQGKLVEERVFAGRPYSDRKEYGGYLPEIRLRLYRKDSIKNSDP